MTIQKEYLPLPLWVKAEAPSGVPCVQYLSVRDAMRLTPHRFSLTASRRAIRPCRGCPLLYSFEPRPGTEDTCEDTASARESCRRGHACRAGRAGRPAGCSPPPPVRAEYVQVFSERGRSRYKLAEHCRADRADGGASREEGATRGYRVIAYTSIARR